MKNSMMIQVVGEVVSHTKKAVNDEAGYAEVVVKYYEDDVDKYLVLIARGDTSEKIFNRLRKGKIILVVGKRWNGEVVYFSNIKEGGDSIEIIDFNIVYDKCH